MIRLLTGLAVLASPLAAQQGAAVSNPHLVISLVPERPAVIPGQPMRVAVRFQAEPGWHIYWRNPGQSGIATSVRWTLPQGFRTDSLAWPVPELYDIAGVLTHVLHGESVLITTLTPPAAVSSSPVRIGAEVRYGVCKDVCLAGQANLVLELAWASTSRGGSAESREWKPALGAAEARRPGTGGPRVHATIRDTVLVLTIRASPGQALPDTLTFFPADRDVLPAAARVAVPRGATSATIRAVVQGSPARVRGVLVAGSPAAARPAGWAVDLRVGSRE